MSLKLETCSLLLFNIYNPPGTNDAIDRLHAWLQQNHPSESTPMIWAGDFNKHHPMWTRPEHLNRCRRSDSDLLLGLLSDHDMTLVSPAGTLTFESDQHDNSWSTLDLVFCSTSLQPRLLTCDVCHDDRIPGSDHLPVHTTLDLQPPNIVRQQNRNFNTVDWKKFEEAMTGHITSHIASLPQKPNSKDELDAYVSNLTSAIQTTICEQVPYRRITPYSKRWWTPELSQLRKEYAKLDRRFFAAKGSAQEDECKQKRNEARNRYNSKLRRTKADHWKTWLEEINEQDIWTAGTFAKTPLSNAGRALIPTLTETGPNGEVLNIYNTAELKAQVFTRLFFPPSPASLPPMADDEGPFPRPLPFLMPRLHQVVKRINLLKPFKAPGNDGIPNIVLKKTVNTIAPYLHQCLTASLQLNYFPAMWREWTTVVLRKPGRPSYYIPKAYRPIALYNTMGKVVSGVMTDIMVYLTVRYSLLPQRHFGGLPGRTTTDSLLYLTHKIKDAWRRRKVVTIIFLDIANAFPNAATGRLLLNMKKLGYPTKLIDFFGALLSDRKTRLSFDDFMSDDIKIDNGIGQGEPASMILYLIYNYALISIPTGRNENGGGYVDDTFFMAIGDTFVECDNTLNGMLDKQDEWSLTHSSKAEVSKFQCLRLTRKRTVERSDFTRTTGQVIQCVETAKLLGVRLDQELRWHHQTANAVKKGVDLLHAVSRLTRPSFGLPYQYARRLFISMVLPKVEYALPVWYTPLYQDNITGRKWGSRGHTKEIEKVQRLGCKILTGAFRCTATDALDVHAFIMPSALRLEASCYRETLRLATIPDSHPLFQIIKAGARRQPRSHPSPIHELFRCFQVHPQSVETVHPTRKHPSWQPEFTTFIGKDRKEAAQHIQRRLDDLQIFTDGSGYKNQVGSAAVIPGTHHALQHRAGTLSKHTVFEGEVIGVLLALQFPAQFPRAKSILIALDNQAAIQALAGNERQSSQYLLDEVHNRIRYLKKRRRRLHIHMAWVPGHENIEGNETADAKAKEASQGAVSAPDLLPSILQNDIPASISAMRAQHKKQLLLRWAELWRQSPRYARISKIDRNLPSPRILKLLRSLPRRASSIIVQLRTGHVALNAFLRKIKAVTTAICLHCRQPETVAHFLIHCKRFIDQRRTLKREVGKAANSVAQLLSNPKTIRSTLRFIAASKRFKDYLDVGIEN